MGRISMSLRAVFALAVLGWCEMAGAQATAIPASRGTTLTGLAVALPDALKGKVGVLVVGFTKPSQGQIQGWGKRLTADYAASAGVAYYEVPVLASAPALARPVIVGELKISVPAEERAHFLPMTQDEAGWLAATHYVQGDDAYVLLIGDGGAVRWHTQGPVTDANYAELKGKIAEMQAAMGPAAH